MILFSLFKPASRNPVDPPQGQAYPRQDLRDRLNGLRREILLIGEELDAAYVGAAGDLHELEARGRDRLRRQTRGPFHHH
jgi:hypothetical protein